MAKEMPMPSTVRIISHEAIDETKVRILVEMIVDVHRLAEVGREFLVTAAEQTILNNPPKR